MKAENVKLALHQLLAEQETVSSGELARRAGVSRQAAHAHLRRLISERELERVGSGRSAAYRRAPIFSKTLPRMGLREDEVWDQVAAMPGARRWKDNVASIIRYALTEIVNNAHDHSLSPDVSIEVAERGGRITFSVSDRGVGIFEKVRQHRNLRYELEAVAELQKGKVTTMPSHHTGEGIFFTSKMADYMTIESHTIRWMLDNPRADQAVEEIPHRVGTGVRFEIAADSDRIRDRVFQAYTTGDRKFSKSKTAIRLFAASGEFVSRSEAKRVTAGLENFQEVELDFKDVRAIGQGFADEVFRVWQNEHPKTKLVAINMNESVRFILERGQPEQAGQVDAEQRVLFAQDAVELRDAPNTRIWTSGTKTMTSSSSGGGSNKDPTGGK